MGSSSSMQESSARERDGNKDSEKDNDRISQDEEWAEKILQLFNLLDSQRATTDSQISWSEVEDFFRFVEGESFSSTVKKRKES